MSGGFHIEWKGHKDTVFNTFNRLLEAGFLSDMHLYCEDKIIDVHKLVLASSSVYFERFFTSNPTADSLFILDIKPNILGSVVQFIYSGTVDIHSKDVDVFMKCLNKWQIRCHQIYKTSTEMAIATEYTDQSGCQISIIEEDNNKPQN